MATIQYANNKPKKPGAEMSELKTNFTFGASRSHQKGSKTKSLDVKLDEVDLR